MMCKECNCQAENSIDIVQGLKNVADYFEGKQIFEKDSWGEGVVEIDLRRWAEGIDWTLSSIKQVTSILADLSTIADPVNRARQVDVAINILQQATKIMTKERAK